MFSKLFKRHDCSVDGHRLMTRERKGYVKPEELFSRVVVYGVTQQKVRCQKCKQESEWIETRRRGIHSFGASDTIFESLDNTGEWFDGSYGVPNNDDRRVDLPNIITPETHPDHEVVGRYYTTGSVAYYCDSYDHRIGYWMTAVDNSHRRDVRETGINTTFVELNQREDGSYYADHPYWWPMSKDTQKLIEDHKASILSSVEES